MKSANEGASGLKFASPTARRLYKAATLIEDDERRRVRIRRRIRAEEKDEEEDDEEQKGESTLRIL